MNIDDSKEKAKAVFGESFQIDAAEQWSESDTRSKLIDSILIEVLGWQEPSIKREPHVSTPHGYIDYILHTSRIAYVVEAKKYSVRFAIPSTKKQRAFKIGGVLSDDKALREAIYQCRTYGISKGTSFCCVTNGDQYIFFRAHSDLGIEFDDHQAVVFDGYEDILHNFSLFYSLLSFDSVCEGHHFNSLPVVEVSDVLARFKQLSNQASRVRYKNRNRLEPFIRQVVKEVFQDLSDDEADSKLIEQCYVESATQGNYEQSLRTLIRDKPTLADGAVRPIKVTRRSAGEFEAVIDDVRSGRRGNSEVLMLLGGIGAGKTTFISRFRRVIAKDKIDKDCLWVYVNFNHYSDAPGELERWVANEVVAEVERGYPALGFGSFAHLKNAYHLEYDRLKKGRLAPVFQQDPLEFEREFARELERYEQAAIAHVIKLLRSVQKSYNRRVFLVFDNADQFNSSLQNDVFMLAHRMSADVGCSLVVSLREESFWKNKDFGVLSAFHGVSLYVEAPDLTQVLSKRFRYASSLMQG